jgi:hypothetical protein
LPPPAGILWAAAWLVAPAPHANATTVVVSARRLVVRIDMVSPWSRPPDAVDGETVGATGLLAVWTR